MTSAVKKYFLISILFGLTACSGSSSGGGGGSTTPANPGKGANFVTFESGQVRPMAMSPDGTKLFVTNTPNSSLEIYAVSGAGLTFTSSVPVGMEPVAVAALSNTEVWVVNHLSDSVSIVDVSLSPAKVTRTLLVGDEPRDIVFAGGAGNENRFAFITAAHRGQNGADDNPIDAQLFTPSVGRADVWVFETTTPGASIGGNPVKVLTMFGDTLRALAVSSDGNTVYASVFFSGNRTTTLGEDNINKRGVTESADMVTHPDTGLIVQFDGTNWRDDENMTTDMGGISYDSRVPFTLPDNDVFTITVGTDPVVSGQRTGVGTTIFNMIVNPATDKVYVSNTEALNRTRFEGPGTGATTVRGHFVESRITDINGVTVSPHHLNTHIIYGNFNGDLVEREKSISQPTDMAITADGNTLYVAGFGSQKIVIYDTGELEGDAFTPALADQITLSAGGPSGVILDETNGRLYVHTRFDNGISIVDTTTKSETAHLTMYNPEPDIVVNGRPFLYDSIETSSHGDSSCGLCHVYGDFDGLAWDLGNPDENVVTNPNQFVNALLRPASPVFHPMKGPMTTQSFRGMKGNGPMHWRGDRVGATAGGSLELRAFKDFNVAFPGLVGRETELPSADMQAFAEFALEITYPPNPIRALNNSLTTSQSTGRDIYMMDLTTGPGVLTCNNCHAVNPAVGNFGTAGLSTTEGPDISQEFKVPHLRNMYQKVGKFGNSGKFSNDMTAYGDQVRGFGFMHDGGMDTLDKFLQGGVFLFDMDSMMNDTKRGQVVDFVMAMDSELAPIVGQQITLTDASSAETVDRIVLLRARAIITAPRQECDLIVKGVIAGEARSYLMQADGSYQSDRAAETLTDIALHDLVNTASQTLTFTCVPPGSGMWMGIDHDEDGNYDRDEIDDGTDPLS